MLLLLSLILTGVIVGALVYYRRTKNREIKEWVWMGFGEDPFKGR